MPRPAVRAVAGAEPRHAEPGSPAKLLRYARHVWPLLLVLLGCILAHSLLELALPWVMGFLLLDTVVKQAQLGELPRVVLLLVGIFFGQRILSFLREHFLELANQRLVHELRGDLFRHLEHLPLRFFDQGRTGELTARVTSDVDAVGGLLPTLVEDVVTDAVLLAGTVYFLFTVSPTLTLFVAPTIPALAVSVILFKPRVKRFARRARALLGDLAAVAGESLAGIRVVKAFTGEGYEARRFAAQSQELLRTRVQTVKLQSLYSSAIDFWVLLGTVIVVGVATPWVVAGTFSVGALVAYLGYLGKLYGPAKKLSKVNLQVQKILAAADRIFEVMALSPETAGTTGATAVIRPALAPRALPAGARAEAPRVCFERVTFGYEGERPALKDFSLEVGPGQVVALVGRSGAGKTTAVNLLLRFYRPTSGRILLDGRPLDAVPLPELRGQIGLVSQDVFLFSGTIRDNIAYARPEAREEDVVEAARRAGAHDFIAALPEGYSCPVGERGAQLSGGQRQRIAIARAWLRHPRILIFDEATSHLDSESERLVQEALQGVARGRTVLLIAHRLSTLWRADKIAVIENGEIVQVGRHEELLGHGGLYRRLYGNQREPDDLATAVSSSSAPGYA